VNDANAFAPNAPDEALTLAAIRSLFLAELAAARGALVDSLLDDRRLYLRATLPARASVRPGDAIRGGLALRASVDAIWVHPYVFREVCRNGAIRVEALESHRIGEPRIRTAEDVSAELKSAFRRLADPAVLADAVREFRAATDLPAFSLIQAIELVPELLRQAHGFERIAAAFRSFESGPDHSRYALLNAFTALARDTADPDLRWNLEELGGAIGAAPAPSSPRDPAAAGRCAASR
jgi:hypothetical protein